MQRQRLIDANALKEEARPLESFGQTGWHTTVYVVDVDDIENAPTVDHVIERKWLLKELDDWSRQVGIYTGDDQLEIARRETVQEMIYSFKEIVTRAPCGAMQEAQHAMADPFL